MLTRRQINQLVIEFNRKGNLSMSAMKAGVTRKTARKYLKLADPHDPPRVAHTWLTRPDEFAEVWSEVEAMLPEGGLRKPARGCRECADGIRKIIV
jgi:hypothetical protein